MKNVFFYLLILCQFLACSKKTIDLPQVVGDPVCLDINVPEPQTKSGDATVASLQVFVFREDGSVDAYKSGLGTSLSLNCTTGQKDIVAVVNAPSLSNIKSKESLASSVSNLTDNGASALVMYGECSAKISQSSSVTVEVVRLVARIGIHKITKKFALQQHQSLDFKVKEIYVINAVGQMKYSSAWTSGLWYNKMGFVSGEADALLKKSVNSLVSASHEETYYFYTYPNPTTVDVSKGTWSNRFTRLVVEAEVGGQVYYYPISIQGIESNHTYDINELIITRLGSDDPDTPISSANANFTITVKDWEVGSSSNETI